MSRSKRRRRSKPQIVTTPKDWARAERRALREFEKNKALVDSGETYRSQASSTWQRKPKQAGMK